mgnify:CR=1 FL=1
MLALIEQTGAPIARFATRVNGLTDITTGNILQLPGAFTFLNNGPTDFTPGVYKVGVACSLSNATVSYWTKTVTITANPSGGPAQINWAQGAVPAAPAITTVTAAALRPRPTRPPPRPPPPPPRP